MKRMYLSLVGVLMMMVGCERPAQEDVWVELQSRQWEFAEAVQPAVKFNISAAEHLGMLYELGNEQYGIYIDKARAQSYYDMLGYNPMDGLSEEDMMPEAEPTIVTYQLSGSADDLKAIEQIIHSLAKFYGTPNGEVNVQGLMKVLVGSDAYEYRGNILSMTYMDEQTLHIQAEVRKVEALRYAISQCFSNIRVEIIEE